MNVRSTLRHVPVGPPLRIGRSPGPQVAVGAQGDGERPRGDRDDVGAEGGADLRRRFQRAPQGFWIPETAADTATLAALAEEGIRFSILSPYQARRIRPPGGEWLDASGARFDPTRPYRVRAGDREIAVFFFDANVARELAFGGGLSSPEALLARIEAGYDGARGHDELLTVAFDGETLGHHKKGADEVLAETLRRMAGRGDVEMVNLGQALERLPLEWEAEIAEGSSWSCAHGLERWRSDCGCEGGGQPGWRQAWRAPLRGALDALRDRLADLFEREAGRLLADPWRSRDRYVELLLDPERREASRFLGMEAGRPLEAGEEVVALQLLEMQRLAMLMYTSCGWFFSEISGLETVQVLKYAAGAIQLARQAAGIDLEPEFRQALAGAPSNLPEFGDGTQVYDRLVVPSVVSLERVGAHLAISRLVQELPGSGRVFCYRYQLRAQCRAQVGPATLTLGRVELESLLTRERLDALFCVMHFGASDFRCGLEAYPGPERHAELERSLFSQPDRLSLAQLLRGVDRFFTGRDYTLRDLFLDERRRVAAILLSDTMRRYDDSYLEIFEDNRLLMDFLSEIDSPIPGPLRVAADVTLSRRLLAVTGKAVRGELDLPGAEIELTGTVQLARRLGAHLHLDPVKRDVEHLVRARLSALLAGKGVALRAAELVGILDLARRLGLELDLWDSQNRLWEWAAARVSLDRETLAQLGRQLWFDEATLEARAGYAPRPPQQEGAPSG